MTRDELRAAAADRLAEAYRRNPAKVAESCDVVIDRSGNLLGWLRRLAEHPADDFPALSRPDEFAPLTEGELRDLICSSSYAPPLVNELRRLRRQVEGHAERIAAAHDVIARNADRDATAGAKLRLVREQAREALALVRAAQDELCAGPAGCDARLHRAVELLEGIADG